MFEMLKKEMTIQGNENELKKVYEKTKKYFAMGLLSKKEFLDLCNLYDNIIF